MYLKVDGVYYDAGSIRRIEAQNTRLRAAVLGIAPWLSASLSDDDAAPCLEYRAACDAVFKADANT